jgi:hypothetical protein
MFPPPPVFSHQIKSQVDKITVTLVTPEEGNTYADLQLCDYPPGKDSGQESAEAGRFSAELNFHAFHLTLHVTVLDEPRDRVVVGGVLISL